MRMKFSRAWRYMRDASLYSDENVWTKVGSDIADALLRECKAFQETYKLVSRVSGLCNVHSEAVRDIWERLQRYPHIFEVEFARQSIDSLALDGSKAAISTSHIKNTTRIVHNGWSVPLKDLTDFAMKIKVSKAMWGFSPSVFVC